MGDITDFRVDTTLLTIAAGRALLVEVVEEVVAVEMAVTVPDDVEATMGDTRITGLLPDDDTKDDDGVDAKDEADKDEGVVVVVEAVVTRAVRVFSWLTAVVTKPWPPVAATVVTVEGPFTVLEAVEVTGRTADT